MYSEKSVGMSSWVSDLGAAIVVPVTSVVNQARSIVGQPPLTNQQVAARIPEEVGRAVETGKDLTRQQVAQIADVPVTVVPAGGTAIPAPAVNGGRSTSWAGPYPLSPAEAAKAAKEKEEKANKMRMAMIGAAFGLTAILVIMRRR